MKILSAGPLDTFTQRPSETTTPVSAVPDMSPLQEAFQDLKEDLRHWREETEKSLETLRQAIRVLGEKSATIAQTPSDSASHKDLEALRNDLLTQQERTSRKLEQALQALEKRLSVPAPSEPPVAEANPMTSPKKVQDYIIEPAGPTAMTSAVSIHSPISRKGALAKLWDYLNESAIEIPKKTK